MSTSDVNQEQRWFPLESNPRILNQYIAQLGFSTALYEFQDVLSTEDWALEMVPQPVIAVILLYPLTPQQLAHQQQSSANSNDRVWFIKQRIGNACGTIGLLHALLNTPSDAQDASIRPNSWLSKFKAETIGLDPFQKAGLLESNKEIATLHDQATSNEENVTSRGDINDKVNTHFMALVEHDGTLYECDGRKPCPISHGPIRTSLLQDSCKVIQTFMARDPEEIRFTILALVPNNNNDDDDDSLSEAAAEDAVLLEPSTRLTAKRHNNNSRCVERVGIVAFIVCMVLVTLLLATILLNIDHDGDWKAPFRNNNPVDDVLFVNDNNKEDDTEFLTILQKRLQPHLLSTTTTTNQTIRHQFLHLHHMKTGGTSMDGLIRCGMDRLRNILSINYTNIHECGRAHYEKCKSGQSPSCLQHIAHASVMSYCAPLQDLATSFGWTEPPHSSMTVLRHPVDRVWSMFRFQTKSCYNCSTLADIYHEIQNDTSTLSDNCRNQLLNHQTRNLMTHPPANNVPTTEQHLQDAVYNLRHFFTLVGLTEDLPTTFAMVNKVFPWLATTLDWEAAINGTTPTVAIPTKSCTLPHKNASPKNNHCANNGKSHWDLPNHPDPATEQLILQHNQLDVQVYRAAQKHFALQKQVLGL